MGKNVKFCGFFFGELRNGDVSIEDVCTGCSRRKRFVFLWRCDPTLSLLRFLDHTQRRTSVCRTPLDEWSARRRDFYLATQNSHNRQTCMPPAGFEPTMPSAERPQTCALDRAATGIGRERTFLRLNSIDVVPVKHLLVTKHTLKRGGICGVCSGNTCR
jgi:hypothetical protein